MPYPENRKNFKKMVAGLDDLIYEDHKIEIERKKVLERKFTSFNDKEAGWHELMQKLVLHEIFTAKD